MDVKHFLWNFYLPNIFSSVWKFHSSFPPTELLTIMHIKKYDHKISWYIILSFLTLKLSICRLIIFFPPQYLNYLKRYYLFLYLLIWNYLDSITCPIMLIWLGRINPKWCIGKHLLNNFQYFPVLVFRWYLK